MHAAKEGIRVRTHPQAHCPAQVGDNDLREQ